MSATPPPLTAEDPAERRAELIARAAALRPQLAAAAAQADRDRRLDDGVIEAVREAGLLRLTAPRRLGGYEADGRALLGVAIELARGCASTAWVVGIMNTASWMAGLYPDAAQAEVWADGPDTGMVGIIPPLAETRRTDGGLIVTGKWPYASGSQFAEWASLGVPIGDGAGAGYQGLALIPSDDFTVEDTWHVAGMRATASNTVVVEEAFVPDHRVISLGDALEGNYATEHRDEVLYRAPFTGMLTFALTGPLVGMALAALDYVIEKAPKRAIATSIYKAQTDSVGFQVQVAEAAAMINAAQLVAERAATVVDEAALAGVQLDLMERCRIRMDTAYVAKTCREAVDVLMNAHGTSGFAQVAGIERIWRDVETASRHALSNDGIAREVYGKALLGVDERVAMLL